MYLKLSHTFLRIAPSVSLCREVSQMQVLRTRREQSSAHLSHLFFFQFRQAQDLIDSNSSPKKRAQHVRVCLHTRLGPHEENRSAIREFRGFFSIDLPLEGEARCKTTGSHSRRRRERFAIRSRRRQEKPYVPRRCRAPSARHVQIARLCES